MMDEKYTAKYWQELAINTEQSAAWFTAAATMAQAIAAERQASALERIAAVLDERLPILPSWAADDLDALAGMLGVTPAEAIIAAIENARRNYK